MTSALFVNILCAPSQCFTSLVRRVAFTSLASRPCAYSLWPTTSLLHHPLPYAVTASLHHHGPDDVGTRLPCLDRLLIKCRRSASKRAADSSASPGPSKAKPKGSWKKIKKSNDAPVDARPPRCLLLEMPPGEGYLIADANIADLCRNT